MTRFNHIPHYKGRRFPFPEDPQPPATNVVFRGPNVPKTSSEVRHSFFIVTHQLKVIF